MLEYVYGRLQTGIMITRKLSNIIGIRHAPKIFSIGFNKTGTSSLHALFLQLGYPSYHGVSWRSCCNHKLLTAYDCFSDGKPDDLSKLDAMFPGSKFILQVRDLESWIYSRLAHIEREKRSGFNPNLSPTWDDTEYAVKNWITARNDYHIKVLSYFADRCEDLIVINLISDINAATTVAHRLGHKGIFSTPKKNRNPQPTVPQKHVLLVKKCLSELGICEEDAQNDVYCESLASENIITRFASDTSLLSKSNLWLK